jgi:SAM-dependent methyltransferase
MTNFDASAEEYLRRFIQQRPKLVGHTKNVLAQEIQSGTTILDIGAGPGILIQLLEDFKTDCTVYGIEINDKFHSYGQHVSKKVMRNRYVPILADARSIEQADLPAADSICLLRSLHEISPTLEERAQLIGSLQHRAKPNGLVLITDPSYIDEVHRNPQKYVQKIKQSQDHMLRTLGHSHAVHELPSQNQIKRVLPLEDMRVKIFEDEMTETTGITKTYWIIGKYAST